MNGLLGNVNIHTRDLIAVDKEVSKNAANIDTLKYRVNDHDTELKSHNERLNNYGDRIQASEVKGAQHDAALKTLNLFQYRYERIDHPAINERLDALTSQLSDARKRHTLLDYRLTKLHTGAKGILCVGWMVCWLVCSLAFNLQIYNYLIFTFACVYLVFTFARAYCGSFLFLYYAFIIFY
jgi:hypothetical protein